MLFYIALVGTIILCARFRIIPMVFISLLVAFVVYMFCEIGILAFFAYFLTLCPWNKFDEKRRYPRKARNIRYENYDSTDLLTYPAAQESYPSEHSAMRGNVYNIENMNVYVNPAQQGTLPTDLNVNSYTEYIGENKNNDWNVTGVDWDALRQSYKSWNDKE